jgi:ParB/RepB/Spo0J family partition protein
MTVKRLGGTSSGKLATISAAVASEMGEVTRQLERPIDRTRGVFERKALESVRPDPENPRNLKLTWEELRNGIDQLEQQEGNVRTQREKMYESIAALADSFKQIGQLQPIILYRDDRGMLRIVDGERRYWAARLADWTEIEAKIRPAKPKYIRLEQYAANVLREDLTLSAHLNNLEMLLTEAEEQGSPVRSLNEFAALVNRPRTTVQQWWSILRGNHEDVKEAIRTGSVTSVDTAYAAAQEPDPGRRAALLEGHALPARSTAQKPIQRHSGRGRRKSAVELGRARDLEIVRKLIEAIPLEKNFDDTDWTDPRSVQSAWKAFIEAFTRHVKETSAPARG